LDAPFVREEVRAVRDKRDQRQQQGEGKHEEDERLSAFPSKGLSPRRFPLSARITA
jgi:hypothetical protein